jgi:ferredoxin-NADP reductase
MSARQASFYEGTYKRLSETQKLRARLVGWKELAPEVHQLDFEVPDVTEFKFTPGQFISVVDQVNGKEKTRA